MDYIKKKLGTNGKVHPQPQMTMAEFHRQFEQNLRGRATNGNKDGVMPVMMMLGEQKSYYDKENKLHFCEKDISFADMDYAFGKGSTVFQEVKNARIIERSAPLSIEEAKRILDRA
jgi:hypothetical protein